MPMLGKGRPSEPQACQLKTQRRAIAETQAWHKSAISWPHTKNYKLFLAGDNLQRQPGIWMSSRSGDTDKFSKTQKGIAKTG